jgi:hypothetical protein
MIPKALRKERCNQTAAANPNEAIAVHTVSSGRAFRLTDVMFSNSDPGMGLRLYDTTTVTTAALSAGTQKMFFTGNPVMLTNIQNGPEFRSAVSAVMYDPASATALPTYAVWIGGYER